MIECPIHKLKGIDKPHYDRKGNHIGYMRSIWCDVCSYKKHMLLEFGYQLPFPKKESEWKEEG